jgi:hypothetical protein
MATKKITREEAEKIPLQPFGKKHPVRILIEELKPGELLRIDRQDFNWKRHTPNYFCNQIAKRGKAKFKMLKIKTKTGWVVERLA